MPTPEQSPHLVVIGSSAGGIDALSILVSTLPADFPAPIVIAQHLEPSRRSHLAEILARRSTLPVETAEDGTHALKPGVVYVVPPNRNVRVFDGRIEVQLDGNDRIKPSVDMLLSSAAEAYGDRLIAVILSGTGSDGAAGARAVKKAGGTVIIQNPETAPFPGMPLSLAPNTVDIVANIERIGPILRDLLAGASVPTQPSEKRDLEQFLDEVRSHLDIDFSAYKTPTILRRLQRRIVATDTDNLRGYMDYLITHPQEYQQLANAFLIKVTDFFRDPDLFGYLRERVLPDLIEYGRRHGNELRVWSAGCATGEEAYSLAILVAEALGPALEQFNVRIFATDVDAEAIAFARRGVYPASALTHLPAELIAKYFTKEDDSYQVRKRVRGLTVFGQHDLAQRAPFPRVDMVVCRNVLIYFTPELQQRTLQLFAYALRDGGDLVLGKAESPTPLADVFAQTDKQHKVYRRHGDRFLMPPAHVRPMVPSAPHRLSYSRQTASVAVQQAATREVRQARGALESVLQRLPVGVIVVDRHYDIQAINSAARQFLSIHGSAIGDDLIHLSQGIPQAALRQAIDATFRSGTQTTIDEFAVEEVTTGQPRYLQIQCYPQRASGESAPSEAVLIVAYDITRLVEARRQLEAQVASVSGEAQQARRTLEAELAARDHLVERLVETNRQLLEANQELTSANEELRTTNEELLLATEEAQAATEEVETLNEEMQATNEELETLNEELQATIEELNTTNDDLHARSAELQDLARTSEEERARLNVVLENMADAVVVVDAVGAPVITNAAYDAMVGGANMPFVPRDESGQELPLDVTLLQRAASGESFSMAFTFTAPNGTRSWFEAKGQPLYNIEGNLRAVVVIHDISERTLHQLQETFVARAVHELRTPLTPLQSYLQQLLKRLPSGPEMTDTRRYAEGALAQVGRLVRLVRDLLDVSRLQTGKYTLEVEPVRLDELVARDVEVGRLMQPNQPIELVVADAPLVVLGDASRLDQVILNLFTNAITYAPTSPRIDVRLRRVGSQAELEVQDYGPGIAPEALPHIFTRFYQAGQAEGVRRQKPGLGLGLHLAKEVVDAHGGAISATSHPGQGAAFTVRLPLASAAGGRLAGD